MKKILFFAVALIIQEGHAHSHNTYIVEVDDHHHHHHHTDVVFVEPVAPVQYVMVDAAPPAEFNEEMGVAPSENYVWVKGHWGWDGYRYVRVNGQWIARPHAAAVWVPGYWSEHHGRWRWNEGNWRY